jgi:hypothetical protein
MCPQCHALLTEADYDAGQCTQCQHSLTTRPLVRGIRVGDNIYDILAMCYYAASRAAWPEAKINAMLDQIERTRSDDDRLAVILDHFDVEG